MYSDGLTVKFKSNFGVSILHNPNRVEVVFGSDTHLLFSGEFGTVLAGNRHTLQIKLLKKI